MHPMRTLKILGLAVAVGGMMVLPAVAAAASPGGGGAATAEGVPAFGHVFLIIGENTGLNQVNKTDMPFLVGTVKPGAAWLTNYSGVTHFSEANYVAMTSGQFTPCQQSDGTPAACHQDVPNLFGQLDAAGLPWKVWAESMPTGCFLSSVGSDATLNPYAPKHNPAIFFDSIEGAGGVWSATAQSAECLANDTPAGTTGPNDMSTFNAATEAGAVAPYNMIVPNLCEDAHDSCMQPPGNRITQFDRFLQREVPLIEASPAFGADGVLIITFDEGTLTNINQADKFGSGGRTAFAVVSPLAVPGTYPQTADHYSLLRTVEDGFGITTFLGNAAAVNPINTIWKP
jgi:phosphatidylinositol-3-phosphatase